MGPGIITEMISGAADFYNIMEDIDKKTVNVTTPASALQTSVQ